jgi:hypothetical protein
VTPVIAAVISVTAASLLSWFVGTRVTYGWDEVKRQRESDLAALKLFYECYGKYFAAWKMWDVYLRSAEPVPDKRFPHRSETAWAILRDVESAEGGFESILVKLAAEYATSERDRRLLAAFRQGAQSLREAMRRGEALGWKAQPFSLDRPGNQEQRILDYRRYRAFKALCEYLALTLSKGPRPPSGRRLFLGSRPRRLVDDATAAAALIEITQTRGIAGRWYEIAEDLLALPAVTGAVLIDQP